MACDGTSWYYDGSVAFRHVTVPHGSVAIRLVIVCKVTSTMALKVIKDGVRTILK